MSRDNVTSGAIAIMAIVLTALTTWMFKVDERQFDLKANVVTKDELRFVISDMKQDLNNRFDRLEDLIQRQTEREMNRGP